MRIIRQQRITILHQRKPDMENINEELQWVGSSLGLFGDRDKDKSCFRIFVEMVKSSSREPLKSDELAYRLGLTRATVVHHLKKLLDSNIVIHDKEGYMLRQRKLAELIDEIERDFKRTCEDIKDVAKKIDERL